MTEEQLTEFLVQSNYIENERTQQAHDDARRAWGWLQAAPSNLNGGEVRGAHYFLMKNLNARIAGHYRQCEVRVGFRVCPQSALVIPMMDALFEKVPTTEETIKEWHIEFEHIHPFEDGNGRTGRIIMNWQRIKQGLPLLVIHEGQEQMEYYEWFQ